LTHLAVESTSMLGYNNIPAKT